MTHHTPTTRRTKAEQARMEVMLRDVYERKIRFDEVLGLKVESVDPHQPAMYFDMRPELVGHFVYGRLHGGAIAAVLDTVGGFAVTLAIAEKCCDENAEQVAHRFGRIGTIDLRVDYLRQGIGKRFHAKGKVIRLGGRIASTQMELCSDSGDLIATAAAAYVVS